MKDKKPKPKPKCNKCYDTGTVVKFCPSGTVSGGPCRCLIGWKNKAIAYL